MNKNKKVVPVEGQLLNPQISIAVCGSGGVGKSALTLQFVKGIYTDDFNPTIEDSYQKILTDGDETFEISIIDTAGQEEFKSLRPIYIRESDAFLIVYDVTNKESFVEIEEFVNEILEVKQSLPPICLIGNKCDLKDRKEGVPKEEGKKRAEKGKFGFYETSAKNGVNITEPFLYLTKQVVKEKKTKEKEKEKKHKSTVSSSSLFYKSFSKESIEETEFKIK